MEFERDCVGIITLMVSTIAAMRMITRSGRTGFRSLAARALQPIVILFALEAEFIGEIGELKAAYWLRSKAKRAIVSGQSSNVPSVLLAIKSGVGIAPLPAPLAEGDPELSCVIGPIAELSYPTYLLTHRDLRKVPRINAFFEFCATELRPVLTGAFKVKSSR